MECNLVFVVKFSGLIHPGGLIANFLSEMMNVSDLSQELVVARRCCECTLCNHVSFQCQIQLKSSAKFDHCAFHPG
jgi:hypothetical protein